MSDLLKTVKVEIKAWERAFRAEQGREPTKEDIKALPELAAKYKTYRQLSKDAAASAKGATSTAEQTNAHASSSKPNGSKTNGSSSYTNDASSSTSAAKRLFQTPTKPKPSATSFLLTPKASTSTNSFNPNGASTSTAVPDVLRTPSRSQIARNPFLSPSALHNPSRPGSSTSNPISSPISRPFLNLSSTPDRPHRATGSGRSVELISNSPRRLKEVLEAASADRRSGRNGRDGGFTAGAALGKEITPRTRARKRLRGEEVEDTPGRTKVPRTTTLSTDGAGAGAGAGNKSKVTNGSAGLGARSGNGIQRTLSSGSGKISRAITPETESGGEGASAEEGERFDFGNGATMNMGRGEDDDEDEEIFGPTPKKGSASRDVGSLFQGGSDGAAVHGQGSSRAAKRKLGDEDGLTGLSGSAGRSRSAGGNNDDGMDLIAPPTLGKGKLLFQTKLVPLVRAQAKDALPPPDERSSSPALPTHQAPMTASTSPSLYPHSLIEDKSTDDDEADELPEPSPTEVGAMDVQEMAIDMGSSHKGKAPQVDEDLAHEVEWSSSEEDDFDDDGEDRRIRRVRKIRVEPYRLALQKRLAQKASVKASMIDSDEQESSDGDSEDSAETHNRSGRDMMSVLSLASPQAKIAKRTEQLHEARAKAVFDPKAKQKLKANRRPAVFLPGEAAHEVDEDGQPVEAEEAEGDDDWESDPDGWKAVGLPDDDDW